jgi:hypothetical protein
MHVARPAMAHDYKRNGPATPFAAMNTLDGYRHREWLQFLIHLTLASQL